MSRRSSAEVDGRPGGRDGEITIRLDYGARNLFGGMIRTSAWADMGLDCEIKTVTDYGF